MPGVKGVAHKSSAATAGVSSFTDLIIKMRLPLVLRQHHSMKMHAGGTRDQRHLYDIASVKEYTASPRMGRLCHGRNEMSNSVVHRAKHAQRTRARQRCNLRLS